MNSTAMFKRKETWAGQSCSTLFMCHVQCLSSKTENPCEYKPDERKKNNFYNFDIVSANGKIKLKRKETCSPVRSVSSALLSAAWCGRIRTWSTPRSTEVLQPSLPSIKDKNKLFWIMK